jgi:hypothetical protein
MTSRHPTVTDAQLEALLQHRTKEADAGLLADVVRAVEATPQRRAWLPLPRSTSGARPMRLATIVAILVLLGVALAVATLLNPTPVLPHNNGAIVVMVPTQGRLNLIQSAPGDTEAPSLPTEPIMDLTAAAFSPDGLELAYSDASGLHLVDVATGEAQLVADCPRCDLAWDPSGARRLVLQGTADADGLVLVDLESGQSSEVPNTSDAAFPTWSPDGQRLLYEATRNSLVTIRPDGTDRTVVAGPDPGRFWSPAWSPDGGTIAYIQFGTGEPELGHAHWALHVRAITPDGEAAGQLDGPSGICTGERDARNCDFGDYQPGLTWSPDGTQLAMVVSTSMIEEVWTASIPADGSPHEQLASGAASGRPAWQPVP